MGNHTGHRLARSIAALAALVVPLALTASLAVPERSSANTKQLSVIMDDDLFVYRDAATRAGTLGFAKSIGVDVVRVTVSWEVIAPADRPAGFVAADSDSYDAGVLDRYDGLARDAAGQGLRVLFNVTYPGPRWAHEPGGSGKLRHTWRPDPAQFGKFVEMIGRRYSGRHQDENEGKGTLPRVSLWSIGNEPNQAGWLAPQWGKARGVRGSIPLSPHIYRELYIAGERGLVAGGHANSTIMLGELAPLGTGEAVNSPVRPAEFLREMFCLDPGLRPYRGAAAKARDCGTLRRLRTRAVALHPYTKNVNPQRKPSNPDHITMANIAKLPVLLDQIAHRTKLIRRGLPVWLTEFGFESRPPDPLNGVADYLQAEWINIGDWLAYKQKRVAAQTQFLIRDAPVFDQHPRNSREYWFGYQSGLLTYAGELKPAFFAYQFPIHVRRLGGRLAIWGQLRFRPKDGEVDFATIEHKRSGQDWRPLRTFSFRDRMRFVNQTIVAPGRGLLRLVHYDGTGRFVASSREVPV